MPSQRLAYEPLTSEVIGTFFDVYNELKYGLLENLYAAGLEIVLKEHGLFVRREVPLEVRFHGERIGVFRADMIVNDTIIVEIKAGAVLQVGSKTTAHQLFASIEARGWSAAVLRANP